MQGNKITKIEQLAVNHEYYCSDSNYYSNDASYQYGTWSEFYKEFKDSNLDYNLVFRWDVHCITEDDTENENEIGGYRMEVFFMQQRKGKFVPIQIHKVTDNNVPEILEFLNKRKDYLFKLWNPL